MDRTERLRELMDTSKNPVYRARYAEPGPSVIDAAYLNRHTVEPRGFAVVDGCEYWMTIKPSSRGSRVDSGLVISLFERELNSRRKKEVSISIPVAGGWNTGWVNVVALLLAEKYEESSGTAHDSLPENGMLKQLIAGRVEYYRRGGNCSKLENRMN